MIEQAMHAEVNEYGRLVYSDVTPESPFSVELFSVVHPYGEDDYDIQVAFHSNLGSLTVLDRVTGFYGNPRDTETGYRSPEGRFWLASGMFDIREQGCKTVGEAVTLVKARANTCKGET